MGGKHVTATLGNYLHAHIDNCVVLSRTAYAYQDESGRYLYETFSIEMGRIAAYLNDERELKDEIHVAIGNRILSV